MNNYWVSTSSSGSNTKVYHTTKKCPSYQTIGQGHRRYNPRRKHAGPRTTTPELIKVRGLTHCQQCQVIHQRDNKKNKE